MRKGSGIALAFVAALLCVSPAGAQQAESLLHEQLLEGVRGLLNRIFGGGDPSAPEPGPPAQAPAAQPAVPAVAEPPRAATVPPGSGASPLHYAVMKGRMQIVDLLLARGADVNSRTRNGTTPLHTAALYSRKEVAERLLERRADINALSASGATPLALAGAAKNRPIAEMLKDRGAR